MKHNILTITIITILILISAGCGPSAEEIATMTASAWTATPLPTSTPTSTPTPTPIPFDLSVMITDEEGTPLEGASVYLAKLDTSQQTDAGGMVSWSDLPGDDVNLEVSAPGYFSGQFSETIQRGPNELAVELTLDPNGFTIPEACLPGENLIYIEDFQDGEAQGWDAVTFGTAGWGLQPAPESSENMTIAAGPLAPNDVAFYNELLPENFVLRVKLLVTGEGGYSFFVNQNGQYELEGQHVENSQYMIVLGTQPGGQGPRTGAMARFQDPLVDIIIANRWEGALPIGFWHYLQISNYQGQIEVWLDGEQIMAYEDPQPLPAGFVGFGNGELDDGTMVFYDDIAVCELNESFQPMPKPVSGYDLNAVVADADGNPLAGVNVTIAEMGSMPDAQQVSDAEGKVSWTDLPGDSLTLLVNAPGYYSKEVAIAIEKGTPAEVSVSLEADPFALLPADACAPGETLLYIEDFQDNQAQGWPEFEFGAPGFSLLPDPAESANIIAAIQYASGNEGLVTQLQDYTFENAVWRFYFFPTARFTQEGSISFNWLRSLESFDLDGTEIFDSRFQIPTGWNYFGLRRLQQPVSNVGVGNSSRIPKAGEWSFIEIGTYQGLTEVWLNGTRLMSYQDPTPLPPGTIGFEAWLNNENEPVLYFDDMSVCELSAPFVPMPATEE